MQKKEEEVKFRMHLQLFNTDRNKYSHQRASNINSYTYTPQNIYMTMCLIFDTRLHYHHVLSEKIKVINVCLIGLGFMVVVVVRAY